VRSGHSELLPREFFDRPSTQVAPDLLGCVLRSSGPDGTVAVRLVEVEAYEGEADPASHAYRGQTARNAVMFGPAGHAYVYFTYGMHFCVNLVCQPPGQPSAVLLRAGQVIEGAALAAERRGSRGPDRDLARGPARLCQALGIDRRLDGVDVCAADSPLRIGPPLAEPSEGSDGAASAGAGSAEKGISVGPRIGIRLAADWPLRFWLTGDRYVSAYRAASVRVT
jgi:DNA-3-methyladenine glycosylase